MDMEQAHDKVINSQEYKDANLENHYLSHVSMVQEKGSDENWEFGYFSSETKKITVFESNPVKKREPDDIVSFDDKVNQLDLDEVVISFSEAMSKAESLANEKKVNVVQKKIILLQKTDKPMWNITFLTTDFNLLNVKLDAVTGKVISADFHSVYDLGMKS